MSLLSVVSLVVLALSSFLMTGFLRRLMLHFKVLDVPNNRSSHTQTQVRGGGLSFVAVFLIALASGLLEGYLAADVRLALMGGGILIAGAGLWDDIRPLSARLRLIVQVVAASLVVFLLGGVPFPVWLSVYVPSFAGDVATVVLLVWMVNAFNFMDGIDGLAAMEAVFIAVFAAVILYKIADHTYLVWLCLGASVLGFLVWNLPPARIFMGDTGSCFLGLTIGVLALSSLDGDPRISVWTWAILAGTFLVDASVTLIRRMLRGETWYQAHRAHAYQHLSRRWASHGRVTTLYLAINILVLGPTAYWTITDPDHAAAIAALVLVPLAVLLFWVGAGLPDKPATVPVPDES